VAETRVPHEERNRSLGGHQDWGSLTGIRGQNPTACWAGVEGWRAGSDCENPTRSGEIGAGVWEARKFIGMSWGGEVWWSLRGGSQRDGGRGQGLLGRG
jgi:hypothetical protein